jgi:hypothetical protein
MEDDAEFLYRIYKVLLEIDFDTQFQYENYKNILLHYNFCQERQYCNNIDCTRLHRLTNHVTNCNTEFCKICIPIRWLILCKRTNYAVHTLTVIPDFVHVDHFAYLPPPQTPPPSP